MQRAVPPTHPAAASSGHRVPPSNPHLTAQGPSVGNEKSYSFHEATHTSEPNTVKSKSGAPFLHSYLVKEALELVLIEQISFQPLQARVVGKHFGGSLAASSTGPSAARGGALGRWPRTAHGRPTHVLPSTLAPQTKEKLGTAKVKEGEKGKRNCMVRARYITNVRVANAIPFFTSHVGCLCPSHNEYIFLYQNFLFLTRQESKHVASQTNELLQKQLQGLGLRINRRGSHRRRSTR